MGARWRRQLSRRTSRAPDTFRSSLLATVVVASELCPGASRAESLIQPDPFISYRSRSITLRMQHSWQTSNPGRGILRHKLLLPALTRPRFAPSPPCYKDHLLPEAFMLLPGQGYNKGGDPIFKTNWVTYSVLHNHEQRSKQTGLFSPFGGGYISFPCSMAPCSPSTSIWCVWLHELPVTAELPDRGSASV